MSAASSPAPSPPSASMVLRMARRPSSSCKKRGNDRQRRQQFSVAQQAEQVLAGVGQFFQPLEAEKARGSLDGVHGAEDFAQQAVSRGRSSRSVRHRSMRSRPSWLSIRNSLVKSSMAHTHPAGRRWQLLARRALIRLYRKNGAQLEKDRERGTEESRIWIGMRSGRSSPIIGRRRAGGPASVHRTSKCISL